ncbi:hypothetical protein P775_00950 [Puniceibacterium antarcticum]|uniref:Uncharacterized protein n=1 Tax=Puniceibacterium antarcticum TaxID=1206336 RepID=A0A2G8RKF5_9RHOB|nr:hypothetical protein [Puniceibacterium antarcticum]PIL22064.1 hypothetical protein P775_00950 [Puniceibacterium antarcticum]
MSTVNDLMTYLNKSLALVLPVLPLGRWTAALTSLWSAPVENWADGEPVPAIVDVVLPVPITMPIAGGKLQMSEAHISIAKSASFKGAGNLPPQS